MKIEKCLHTEDGVNSIRLYRVACKRSRGLWSTTRREALGSWMLHRYGVGINTGRQYDDNGVFKGKVFALQTREQSGRFCKTIPGAIFAFMFRPKHDV